MGLFGDIKGKRGTQGGVYFEPGLYLVEVNRVKLGKTRKGEDFFVVETKLLESDNENRPEGSSCSWMVMFKHDAALGNIADFCRAGLYACAVQNEADPGVKHFEEIEIEDDDAEEICSEENPLAGTVLKVEAVNVKTRAGKDFTKVTWAPPK